VSDSEHLQVVRSTRKFHCECFELCCYVKKETNNYVGLQYELALAFRSH